MYQDRHLTVSIDQAITASAASTDYIDLGVQGRDVGMGAQKFFALNITETMLAAGAATLTISMEKDDNVLFSSPIAVFTSAAIPKASLVAGYQMFIQIPVGLDERYVRFYYTVGTGPMTAGKITCGVVDAIQKNKHYPDAIAN